MKQAKKAAAQAALAYVNPEAVLGVGSGSTVEYFISALAGIGVKSAVAASEHSASLLRKIGVEVVDLNTIGSLSCYIDGADAVDQWGHCLKGGGAALTREKILAQMAEQFICIVDESKYQPTLSSEVPLTLEVIPMARSLIARRLVALGGNPEYRVGKVTDNGQILLDVYGLDYSHLSELSAQINQWPGVISHGLFYQQKASCLLVGSSAGHVEQISL